MDKDPQILEQFPALKKGEEAEVPHVGNLSQKAIEGLKKRGYKPVDIRFVTDSERLINLAVQGTMMGTVELTQNMISALRLRAQVDNLLDSKRERSTDTSYNSAIEEILQARPKDETLLKSKAAGAFVKSRIEQPEELDLEIEQPDTKQKEAARAAIGDIINGLRI